MVSAWVGEQNLTLGELVAEEKSNEIRAVPELLDMLDELDPQMPSIEPLRRIRSIRNRSDYPPHTFFACEPPVRCA